MSTAYPDEIIMSIDGGSTNVTYTKKRDTTTTTPPPPPPTTTTPPPPPPTTTTPPPPPPPSTTTTPLAVDKNGIAYLQPLLSDGYKLTYSNETWTFRKNFRTDGSQRCDFEGNPKDSAFIAGYFKPEGSDDGEEVAAKLNGGPHSSSNPSYADVIDMGITNFLGTKSRVRWEKDHPQYSSNVATGPGSQLPIGDVRNKWLGYCGFKVNLDTNNDGKPDSVAVIGMVDVGGLDANGKPKNQWKVTYKRIFKGTEIPLKSIYTCYMNTIGKSDQCQQTIRIDQQPYAKWTSADPPYKFVTCKEVKVSKV